MNETDALVIVVDNQNREGAGQITRVDGEQRVLIHLPSGGGAFVVPFDLLDKQEGNRYRLDAAFDEFAQSQTQQTVATAAATSMGRQETVIPIVEEQLRVGKRVEQTGGVRVRKIVREHEETFNESLLREHVDVQRVTVGRMVDEPEQTRQEGDTLVIPLMEEVLEVKKRFLLKEEVRITRRSETVPGPQTVIARSEEVVIERLDRDGKAQPMEVGAGVPGGAVDALDNDLDGEDSLDVARSPAAS